MYAKVNFNTKAHVEKKLISFSINTIKIFAIIKTHVIGYYDSVLQYSAVISTLKMLL